MTARSRDIISSPEALAEYRAQVAARLAARKERRPFLEEAIEALGGDLEAARAVGFQEMVEEVAAVLEAARTELGSLQDVALSEIKEADGPSPPLPAPPTPPSHRPVTVVPARTAAPPPKGLRPVNEIDREVNGLAGVLDTGTWEGGAGLLRLKALGCRQRRAYWELEEQGEYSGHARALYGVIKGRVLEQFGERRVLPLNTGIAPAQPILWEELARAYEALATAQDAFEWYREEGRALSTSAARELLECIGAVQQRLFRRLQRDFHAAGDDQQRGLYEALLVIAEEARLFLDALHPRCPDSALETLAAALPKVRERAVRSVAAGRSPRPGQESP